MDRIAYLILFTTQAGAMFAAGILLAYHQTHPAFIAIAVGLAAILILPEKNK